jgi:neutral ceramidase
MRYGNGGVAMTSELRAATGVADITPSRPIRMAGFAARKGMSQGVYQSLFVKALVLEDDDHRVALVCADLCSWGNDHVQLMRQRLADECGLAADQLIPNVSHTHCGPSTRDADYAGEVVAKTVDLVKTCLTKTKPVRLFVGKGRAAISVNRRRKSKDGEVLWGVNPYGPVDHEVTVVKAVDSEGQISAVVTNYACHPSTIGGYLIGGDYVGFSNQFIEQELPGTTALFVQGAGGDLKPYHVKANDPLVFEYEGGPPRPRAFGRQLADAVLDVLAHPMQEITGPLRSGLEVVHLPLMEDFLPDEDEALFQGRRRRAARLAQLMLASIDEAGEYKRTQPCEVLVVRIGPEFILVGLNGEVCVRIGLRTKAQLVPNPVLFAGYTGILIGYVPSADMIPEKGYEAGSQYTLPYSLEAEDFLVDRVMEIVNGLE